MQELNSLRQAIGIASTGFELSRADYKELLIFSAANEYAEFRQACDNVQCKYPTLTEFVALVNEIRDEGYAQSQAYADDQNKIRMYPSDSAPLIEGRRIERSPTKAEVLAYFSRPSSSLSDFAYWKRSISNQRRQAQYGFTADDLKLINAEHQPLFRVKAASPAKDEIIAHRNECGLSQVDAAALLNVSVSTFRAWEYGQNPMPVGLWELFQLKTKTLT